MTIFLVTKWESGVIESIDGCNLNKSDPTIAEKRQPGEITQYFGKGDWYKTRLGAVLEAKRLRVQRIKQMRDDIKTLSKLSFD